MGAQIVRTAKGEEFAFVPRAEYERLRRAAEDLDDVRAADGSRARIKAGKGEMIPWDVATRLLDKENPIRVWREHRGFSVAALAAEAGITPSYLSQIEGGGRVGKLATIAAIARALRVSLDRLVKQPEAAARPRSLTAAAMATGTRRKRPRGARSAGS